MGAVTNSLKQAKINNLNFVNIPKNKLKINKLKKNIKNEIKNVGKIEKKILKREKLLKGW